MIARNEVNMLGELPDKTDNPQPTVEVKHI